MMFFLKILRVWEEQLDNDPTLEALPFHGEFWVTNI